VSELIVAVATPPGRGGIGIVRASGADVSTLIHGILGRSDIAPRRAIYTRFLDADNSTLDAGVALFYPAPHSYTGENVLELQGHGGPAVLAGVVSRCLALGARLAEPGEFTRRAFLNDRLDLAQAEAVADLIDADTRATAKAALRSLAGDFSRDITALVDALIRLRMLVEASIDFPDEDIEFVHAGDAQGQLEHIATQLDAILSRARQGQLLRDGLRVVLIGRPNVGKSSLLNCLAREDVAIVTAVPGTTRDTVRQRIEIGGLAVHLVDTAGVRDLTAADEVEKLGIARTWTAVADADCALVVVDAVAGETADDAAIAAGLSPSVKRVIVHNKIDLVSRVEGIDVPARREERQGCAHVFVSARTGEGIDILERAVLDAIGWLDPLPDQFLARERHIVALRAAHDRVEAATVLLEAVAPPLELVAEELRLAQFALSSITGAFTADDLLGEIFSRFCIGK
jgi:tRNA modification GTPase